MNDSSPPYWVLISVLFSSKPLAPGLAMDLYHVAHRLHQKGDAEGQIKMDLAQGTVINLKKDIAMGAITGPLFEAEVDTERGHATVRFLITRDGLEYGPREVPASQLN